ncbi:MAG: DUF58 domain-containing protein, partial [Saprospiraceae bacterium]
GYDQALTIACKKHDIIGVHIHDKREEKLPNVGLIQVADAETGIQKVIDTSDPDIREAYAKHYNVSLDKFNKYFAFAKSDTISISTEEDYIKALQIFFKRRAKR